MAPIESSQRALSIGAIGFARGHVLNRKMDRQRFRNFKSNQIKSWENGRQIKSNHVVLKKRQIKSNHAIEKMCQIKSNQIKRSKNPSKSNQIKS